MKGFYTGQYLRGLLARRSAGAGQIKSAGGGQAKTAAAKPASPSKKQAAE